MSIRAPFLKRFLALTLALALTPGLAEAVENVWHLAENGHSAHAVSEGADHERGDDEHGCSGTFHVCSCHHASSTLPVSPAPQSLRQAESSVMASPLLPLAPWLAGLLRPPQS